MSKGRVLILTCVGCGDEFEHLYKTGGTPKRCPPCKADRLHETRTKARRKYEATNKGKVARRKRYKRRRGRQTTEERLAEARKWYFKRTYGLSLEEVQAMADAQGNECAICGYIPPPERRPLAIDHDHETGFVRGLICDSCNLGIGKFKDDPERLRNAADYLEWFQDRLADADPGQE